MTIQQLLQDTQMSRYCGDFTADALLGNFDRHNGNWGILVDEQSYMS